MAVPAWEMASNAYSTWYRRPSGEKMVVWSCGKLYYLPMCCNIVLMLCGLALGGESKCTTNLLGNRISSTWRLV